MIILVSQQPILCEQNGVYGVCTYTIPPCTSRSLVLVNKSTLQSSRVPQRLTTDGWSYCWQCVMLCQWSYCQTVSIYIREGFHGVYIFSPTWFIVARWGSWGSRNSYKGKGLDSCCLPYCDSVPIAALTAAFSKSKLFDMRLTL